MLLSDRVLSRSWHGLWNTIKLKLLYYNLLHAELLSSYDSTQDSG